MIRELLTRVRLVLVRNLFLRKTRREMDEELRFHVEQSITARVAEGIPVGEARRLAMVEFGGLEAAREDCERQRPGWWMPGLAGDVRYAMRGILTHGWFSAAIVATLALGIGLNTMVFTLVNAALFKPVPVPGGGRLVSVMSNDEAQNSRNITMSYPDYADMKVQSRQFEWFEAVDNSRAIVSEDGSAPQMYHLAKATTGIFEMVQGKALLGRMFEARDAMPGAAPVMVIGYGIWKDRYASDARVLGREVRVNGLPATIVGVMPEGFKFPNGFDVWMPLQPTTKRDDRPLWVYGILKPDTPVRAANAELQGIAGRLAAKFPEDKQIGASVLSFHERFNGGNIRLVFLLMLAAVGFVLLIACADVANMMLSRTLSRQREMSIRTALGATRWRMIRQLLIESVMLSTVGGVMGLGLATFGVRWFDMATKEIRPYWIEFTTDYRVFGYFAGLCVLSGLLFGIAPALRSSKPDLMGVLKDGAYNVGRRRGGWLSGGLVVFQFALTLALLTGAGIFVKSLMSNLAVNPFIPSARIMTARAVLPETRYKDGDGDARQRFFDGVMLKMKAIPGARHAALVSDAPGLGSNWQPIEREHVDAKPEHRPVIGEIVVSPEYFETIGLPILRGRGLNETDGSAHHGAVVVTRDTANKLWPGEDALGKRVRLTGDDKKPMDWMTVVGISADMVQELVEDQPKPIVFVPYKFLQTNNMTLMLDAEGDPLPEMRKAVAAVDSEMPLSEPFRLDAAVAKQVWFLKVFGKIFGGFALIAMLMAAVGLYSVIAYATSSRTQEIGVRIALGARVKDILLLVMRRGLLQVGVGLLVGLGAALALAKVMAGLPLGGAGPVWMIFPVVAGMLALVGVFACWLPARRAAGLDPVKAIRCE
ncbi:ABC transporter permease [Terracidiphilus gabretensis]|uniref:ABC transporter permease n=1 Tax=Terracidiphilus gabretensis TaxID=1577687 RepID=UPI00071B39EA|nr:ABC transporter permease [Terracidiphilus gabretensis]